MLRILLIAVLLSALSALPLSFSWSSQGSRNYLGSVLNQNNPHRCESAWAIATTSALSARINIAMDQMHFHSPLVSLSPQSLLQCDSLNFGCLGGQPGQTLRWIIRNNLTDSSCNSYKAKGYTNGASCSSKSRCQVCWNKDKCQAQGQSKVYSFRDLVSVGGETAMANEIGKSGPIVCGISATSEFKGYTRGVFEDKSGAKNHNHYVVVYGWGEENGKKYWSVQNSYGPTWGEEGSMRISRGNNNLGIESLCYGATPVDTWTNDLRNDTLPSSGPLSVRVGQPLPQNLLLTASHSQLTPNYCDASWAFAITHALADGQLAKSNGQFVRSFSVQALLNCGVGSCEKGGNPHDALSFINKYGLPQQGCQHYQSVTPSKESCSAVNNCASCGGNSIFKDNCTEVKNYKRWKIYSFGQAVGPSQMGRQLINHHALVCGIQVTQAFKQYKGNNIFSEITVAAKVNHWVEVVGQGSEGGVAYWLGRNSWGTAWGMGGFFKIKKGGNNLGIESKCYWIGDIV